MPNYTWIARPPQIPYWRVPIPLRWIGIVGATFLGLLFASVASVPFVMQRLEFAGIASLCLVSAALLFKRRVAGWCILAVAFGICGGWLAYQRIFLFALPFLWGAYDSWRCFRSRTL